MKSQWALLLGLLFAIVIAIFAVVNVEDVQVDYVFGEATWPLILVILFSALLGALISISFAIFRMFNAGRNVKSIEKQLQERDSIIIEKDREIKRLQDELNKPAAYVPPANSYTPESNSYTEPIETNHTTHSYDPVQEELNNPNLNQGDPDLNSNSSPPPDENRDHFR